MKEPTSKQNTTNSRELQRSQKQMSELSSKCTLNSTCPDLNTQKTMEPTGLNIPYVVTIDHSDTVLSIRRNYEEADPLADSIPTLRTLQVPARSWLLWLWFIHLIGSIAQIIYINPAPAY